MSNISIIIPVYEAEKYLNRCVDSVLRQSYQDFEIILVDDGSPDDCGRICDEYAEKDSRIHVIHQENSGVSAARNAGIEWALKHSNSGWLSFLDSDDWLHKDFLKILLSNAEEKQAEISMCGLHWTEKDCEDSEMKDMESFSLDPELALVQFHPMCTTCCSKIVAKPLFRELRFPVGMRYEDAYISHILTLSANRVAVCSGKLYYYYSNPESFTRVKWTEGRLVAIAVHEKRMAYFLENGYTQAYRKEQHLYMEVLTENLQNLMDLLDEGELYRKNFQMIREKHRRAFQNAKAQGNISFSWETMWFYFFAAPTDIVWKTAGFAQKVYHKIKK